MNIGFDIDGTFTDFYGFVQQHGAAFLKKEGQAVEVNPQGYDVDAYYQLQKAGLNQGQSLDEANAFSEGLLKRFWDRYYLAYLQKPFIPGVVRAAQQMRKAGHHIHIISSRKGATRKTLKGRFIKYSIIWQLWRNGIRYDQLTLCENDDKKLEVIKHAGLDLFVEDKPHMIAGILPHCACVAMAWPYNQPLAAQQGLAICKAPEDLPHLLAGLISSRLA